MKKLMVATAVLALLSATGALAQDREHGHGDRGGEQGAPRGEAQGHRGEQGGGQRPAAQAQPAPAQRYGGAPAYQPQARPEANGGQWRDQHRGDGGRPQGGDRQGWRGGDRGQDQGWRGGDRGHNQGWHGEGGRGHDHDRGDFHPGWGAPGFAPGGHGPRYDQRWFPREVRPEHRFRWGGDWRPQRGYYYRHWGYGDYLPFGWFADPYWVTDYWDYDLPVPPFGYQWVRVGPDVLLINIATGFVAETIYGLYY